MLTLHHRATSYLLVAFLLVSHPTVLQSQDQTPFIGDAIPVHAVPQAFLLQDLKEAISVADRMKGLKGSLATEIITRNSHAAIVVQLEDENREPRSLRMRTTEGLVVLYNLNGSRHRMLLSGQHIQDALRETIIDGRQVRIIHEPVDPGDATPDLQTFAKEQADKYSNVTKYPPSPLTLSDGRNAIVCKLLFRGGVTVDPTVNMRASSLDSCQAGLGWRVSMPLRRPSGDPETFASGRFEMQLAG